MTALKWIQQMKYVFVQQTITRLLQLTQTTLHCVQPVHLEAQHKQIVKT